MSVLLILHISAGSAGLLSGAVGLISRKGSAVHRGAGNVFFVAMLFMATSGIFMSLARPVFLTALTGALTAYLVLSSWVTIGRRSGQTGAFEMVAATTAFAIAAALAWLGWQVATGALREVVKGVPLTAESYFVFAGLAGLAGVADMSARLRRRLGEAHRIARHLWRMCFALVIAAASVFQGQTQVFPAPLRDSVLLFAPVLSVTVLMVFWLWRTLSAK